MFAQDEINYDNIINVKWQMKRYVIDGLSLPIERNRKKIIRFSNPIINAKNYYSGKKSMVLGNIYLMENLL